MDSKRFFDRLWAWSAVCDITSAIEKQGEETRKVLKKAFDPDPYEGFGSRQPTHKINAHVNNLVSIQLSRLAEYDKRLLKLIPSTQNQGGCYPVMLNKIMHIMANIGMEFWNDQTSKYKDISF